MTEQDARKFAELMVGLSVTFDKELKGPIIEIYFRALSDFNMAQVEHAFNLAITSCTFFPKPAELRQFIEGKPDEQSTGAWEVVVEANRRGGYYRSVMFEDGAIGSTINRVFGGWPQCCEALSSLSDEMIASKRKEFGLSYRNARREGRSVHYLPGQHEIENRNSISTWTRDKFGPTYKQQVYIARSTGGHLVDAEFDRSTGALIGGERALFSAEPQRLQIPNQDRKQITDGSEVLSPEEGRAFFTAAVQDLTTSMTMPKDEREPMSREELLARVRELKEQASMLGAESDSEVLK